MLHSTSDVSLPLQQLFCFEVGDGSSDVTGYRRYDYLVYRYRAAWAPLAHRVLLHMLSLTFYDDFHIDCFYILSHAFSTVEESHDTSIDLIYSIKCRTRDASSVIY